MKRYSKKMKKLARTMVALVLALLLTVSGNYIVPSLADEGSQDDSELTKTLSGAELLNLNKRKPEGYDESSDVNPLNIGKDEKGGMAVTNNELQIYENRGESGEGEVSIGDTFIIEILILNIVSHLGSLKM